MVDRANEHAKAAAAAGNRALQQASDKAVEHHHWMDEIFAEIDDALAANRSAREPEGLSTPELGR